MNEVDKIITVIFNNAGTELQRKLYAKELLTKYGRAEREEGIRIAGSILRESVIKAKRPTGGHRKYTIVKLFNLASRMLDNPKSLTKESS